MKTYDVQTIEIKKSYSKVFDFIMVPENLPKWALGFKMVDGNSAVLETPNGAIDIGLEVKSDKNIGNIDWHMRMPDGSKGQAFSRVIDNGRTTIFSFVLMAPPVPLELIEGTLEQQMKQLKEELTILKDILDE